jgi:hypothetical protein
LSIYSGILPATTIDLTGFVDRAIADISPPAIAAPSQSFSPSLTEPRIFAETVTSGA